MSWRVFAIALFLIAANSLWMMTGSLWNAGYPTTVSLFFNTILFLLLLVLVNVAVRKTMPRWGLSNAELLLIYTMTTVAAAINGLDMLQLIGAMIAGPHALATPENQWGELFLRQLPSWLVVSRESVLEAYIEGESSAYSPVNLLAWMRPVAAWSAFTVSLLLVMIGLSLLVSSRWAKTERLSYPIIQLPMRLTEDGFLRHRSMWVGFAIGALMGAANGFHFFYPAIPTVGKPVDIGRFITQKPWNAIGWLPIAVQPFAVGLAFLVPLEISFSSWFFYFFWKGERVLASAVGARMAGFPFVDEQTSGAYMAFAVASLWTARRHIGRVFHSIRLRDASADDRRLARYSFGFMLAGMAGIAVFCLYAGMGVVSIALFFGGYWLISLSISRIRAELGSPVHDLHFSGPGRMMVSLFGSRTFQPRELTVVSLFWFFNRAYRSHPMPCVLEGFQITERSGVKMRHAVLSLVVASVAGVLAGFWGHLQAAYRHGAGTKVWPALETFRRLSLWLREPTGAELRYTVAFGAGAVSVFALNVLRNSLLWFPLHPVGFVVSSSWAMNPFWFSIFVAWALKTFLLRLGGLGAYRKAVPMFLGLILGEFVVDGGFSVAGTLLRVRTYIWYG